jgi:hypothetical protein
MLNKFIDRRIGLRVGNSLWYVAHRLEKAVEHLDDGPLAFKASNELFWLGQALDELRRVLADLDIPSPTDGTPAKQEADVRAELEASANGGVLHKQLKLPGLK